DARGGLHENEDDHNQRDDVQDERNFRYILDSFYADVGHDVAPDDGNGRKGKSARVGVGLQSTEDEVGSQISGNGKPADLQQAHQESGHQIATLRSERGATDDIKRESGFHAQHGGCVVVEREAQQTGHQQSQHAQTDAGTIDSALRDGLVESDPEEHA